MVELSRHDERELLNLIVSRLSGIPEMTRQALADHQWAKLAAVYNEFAYLASATTISTAPQSSNDVIVHCIVATLPSNSTGLLQLGPMTLPLAAGLSVVQGANFLLAPGDTRTIDLASGDAAGPMSLWLSGEVASPINRLT